MENFVLVFISPKCSTLGRHNRHSVNVHEKWTNKHWLTCSQLFSSERREGANPKPEVESRIPGLCISTKWITHQGLLWPPPLPKHLHGWLQSTWGGERNGNNVHSSVICISHKVATSQMPIKTWMDKRSAVCPKNGMLLRNKEAHNVDRHQEHYAKWRNPDKKSLVLFRGNAQNRQIYRAKSQMRGCLRLGVGMGLTVTSTRDLTGWWGWACSKMTTMMVAHTVSLLEVELYT